MPLRAILISDLHLTDNQEDSYRWHIFNVILKRINSDPNIKYLFILGDLTHFKNNHSAILVNKITGYLAALSKRVEVVLIMGNHDYEVNPENPYFYFLNNIENITFVKEPTLFKNFAYLVPHSNIPINENSAINFDSMNYANLVLFHETFNKAVTSNGQVMQGTSFNYIKDQCSTLAFSGDIHVPQELNGLIYVGTQYPINYGDVYKPRYIILNLDSLLFRSIPINTIRKESLKTGMVNPLSDLEELGLIKGDMLKIDVRVSGRNVNTWRLLRKQLAEYCISNGIFLKSITASRSLKKGILGTKRIELNKDFTAINILESYIRREGLTNYQGRVGKELLK